MGSNNEIAIPMLRKTMNLKAKKPQVDSLKELRSLLELNHRSTFTKKYEKILDLLDVEVQIGAITALAQFYDSPLRCFTFQDFQLAPTLEEFGPILGYSLENRKPYRYMGNYPSTTKVAEILRVGKEKLISQKKKGTSGFLRSFFEERAHHLAKAQDWSALMEVLALTIYGVVLFPSDEEIIDLAAINVFLALKNRRENPTTAVLADVYYTLNYCYEKKGKRILCCLPILYVWLVNHMFDSGFQKRCPINDFKNCYVDIKDNREWDRRLVDLNEKTVRWYARWREVKEVIYQCGTFSNVLLMGTGGCVNYNPVLALRQLGYPIIGEPMPKLITHFILYDMGPENIEDLRRVRQSWNTIIKKGKELGSRSCGADDCYRQWVKNRVQEIKLPFRRTSEVTDETPMQPPIVSEEIEKLQASILEAKEEKKNMQEELMVARRAYEIVLLENEQKTISLERSNKREKVEEDYKLKLQCNLRASDLSLCLRRQERDQAREEVEKLRKLLKDSEIGERNAKRKLEDLKQQLERVRVEYKTRIEEENVEKKEVVAMSRDVWLKEQEEANMLKN